MTMVPEIAFSHAGIHVHDLEGMADFYGRVLGFAETDRGELFGMELVFLSRDPGEHHQLVLVSGRSGGREDRVLNQLSYRVGSLADLRAFRDLLRAEPGVTEIRPINHGIAWSVYFRDPEGNRIELFADSPWHVAQPIADGLDLDLSDDEIRRLTEARYRDRPGFQPRAQWRAALAERLAGAGDQRPRAEKG